MPFDRTMFPFTEQSNNGASPRHGDLTLPDKRDNNISFCGDSENLLDRMLEQCQNRVTTRHPGFGRKLVPYFNDGLSENGIKQHQQKGENCCYSRGSGKSSSQQPQGYKRSPRSSKRMSGGNSRRGKKSTESNVVITTTVGPLAFTRGTHDNKGASSPTTTTTTTTTSSSTSREDSSFEEYSSFQAPNLCALFAGPICFNSPPPEALPMPTAVLLAKAMCLS